MNVLFNFFFLENNSKNPLIISSGRVKISVKKSRKLPVIGAAEESLYLLGCLKIVV